jgi:hypothetical protein
VWRLQIVSVSEVHVVHYFKNVPSALGGAGVCLFCNTSDGAFCTVGNLITSIVFLMALMDLKENAAGQVFGFLVPLVTSAQFIVQFAMSGKNGLGKQNCGGHDWDDLFGVGPL